MHVLEAYLTRFHEIRDTHRGTPELSYRKENEAALRQDWPRVPIPADRQRLAASAALGRTVADLLLPDKPARGSSRPT